MRPLVVFLGMALFMEMMTAQDPPAQAPAPAPAPAAGRGSPRPQAPKPRPLLRPRRWKEVRPPRLPFLPLSFPCPAQTKSATAGRLASGAAMATYRSFVNLGSGPKLLGADFTITDPKMPLVRSRQCSRL